MKNGIKKVLAAAVASTMVLSASWEQRVRKRNLMQGLFAQIFKNHRLVLFLTKGNLIKLMRNSL